HAGDRSWTAPHAVAATGTWSPPSVPPYPGLFTATQWHSPNYPGVGPFRGWPGAGGGAGTAAGPTAAELTGVAEATGVPGKHRRADRGRTHRCCRSHLVYPPSTTVDARRGRRAGAVSPEPTTRPGRPARRDRSGGRLRARRHCRAA